MAGKRLLDAAKILNAAGSVAKQHLALRQQQWDIYSRTSSLAKAVRHQTDRVTVTANAALELAKRLNETGPSWQQSREQTSQQDRSETWSQEKRQDSFQAQNVRADRASDDRGSLSEQVAPTQQQSEDGLKTSMRKDEQSEIHEHVAAAYMDPSSATGQSQARHNIPPQREDVSEEVNIGEVFTSSRVSRMVGQTGPNIKNPYGAKQRPPARPLPEMIAAEKERQRNQINTPESGQVLTSESKSQTTAEHAPLESEQTSRREPQPANDTSADEETQHLAQSIAQASGAEPQPAESPESAYEMHESRVPVSRFGRLWQYGGLATSMAFGAVGESFRRVTGSGSEGSVMMSEANMNRLVAKLSRMRGAALKLGQMVSFQDSRLLPATINTILQRVQDSADYMPPSQRDKVLRENLGDNWRDLFSEFAEKPFAAASIGQVHRAKLASNGKDVAVKVQYPGVRNSIDSDLNNLSMLLTASRLLPKGLFLDKTIANARTELAWECDYEREAQACIRFKELLQDELNIFTVPEIYTEASGAGVLTAEFVHGSAVTKMKDLSQDDRDWVGTQILRLCLRELMEWRFMQTDPNWTNFLYNRKTKKLELLDFGASREFPSEFVEPYVSLLIAASKGDRDRCRELSIDLGYLTGQEGKDMVKAHVDSILTLAEPFVESAPEVYDFEDQTITDRVRENIGLMLRERLAPPPEETYSLHRKLSGSFLLCARLQSRVRARDMFAQAVEVWNGRNAKI